ncbi:helix-turn-helix transcriptional regulator [Microvirga sp. 3-52]|uniref:helix-turn-helix domain-containing protein n=1 Tax=Microvirga sp. 3-52 TaxID=2792425 RepID=UPI001AC2CAB6|nr:helix-turn-helix transcriptional regulator [Microvirga sp. 3-52]MBO1908224.1 helix-turn-helix transcriptional regulator [Microvirga sp. 3-52]MBS7454895.1 helix-turn-helix transcriptional regulator [Microvirga sp. 3-52]
MAETIFARMISERRKDMNLSLRELARVTGIAASTISRIENGRLSPTLDIVAKLTSALNLEPSAANLDSSSALTTPEPVAPSEEPRQDGPTQVVVHKTLGSTILQKGIRRDLSRIAARNGYEIAILVKGTCELRTNAGFSQTLRPGATINCKLIAKQTYFATAEEEAELLWIG